MAILYSSYYTRKYFAPLLSCQTFTCAFGFLLTLLIPFVIVYETNNLWTKHGFYYEQPMVTFSHELVLQVLDEDGSKLFSTIKKIDRLSLNELGVPLIKV